MDVLKRMAEADADADADAEIRRQADLIADHEAELPKGVLNEQEAIDKLLKDCRKEAVAEAGKGKTLILNIGTKRDGMLENRKSQKEAGREAREALPPFERRRGRHKPRIGLEKFVQRARRLSQATHGR